MRTKKSYLFSLDAPTFELLKAAAKEQGKSMSFVIRGLIQANCQPKATNHGLKTQMTLIRNLCRQMDRCTDVEDKLRIAGAITKAQRRATKMQRTLFRATGKLDI
jgi:hypothetical protein